MFKGIFFAIFTSEVGIFRSPIISYAFPGLLAKQKWNSALQQTETIPCKVMHLSMLSPRVGGGGGQTQSNLTF